MSDIITYADLKVALNNLTDEQLKQRVQVVQAGTVSDETLPVILQPVISLDTVHQLFATDPRSYWLMEATLKEIHQTVESEIYSLYNIESSAIHDDCIYFLKEIEKKIRVTIKKVAKFDEKKLYR